MRKVIYIIIALIVLIGVYLYLANAYIYYKIGRANLSATLTDKVYAFNPELSSRPITYLALGDSLTAGVGVDNYKEAYPYLVAEDLTSSSKKVNLQVLATPGYRSEDSVANYLIPASTRSADIITILIGVNDIHDRVGVDKFRSNYQTILETLTSKTKAKIYLISIPLIGSPQIVFPPYRTYFAEKTELYNQAIKDLAKTYKVNYIDINSGTEDLFRNNSKFYAADLFHPSNLGYKLWANIIYDSLNQ